MTPSPPLERKVRQLDNDVQEIYIMLHGIISTQSRHGVRLDEISVDVSDLKTDVGELKTDVGELKESMGEVLTILRGPQTTP